MKAKSFLEFIPLVRNETKEEEEEEAASVRLCERENKRREYTTRRRERAQSIVDFDRRLSLSSCKKKKKKKSLSLLQPAVWEKVERCTALHCTVRYCEMCIKTRASPATPVTGSSYKGEKETQYSTCITDQPRQPSRTSPPAHTVKSLRSVGGSVGLPYPSSVWFVTGFYFVPVRPTPFAINHNNTKHSLHCRLGGRAGNKHLLNATVNSHSLYCITAKRSCSSHFSTPPSIDRASTIYL